MDISEREIKEYDAEITSKSKYKVLQGVLRKSGIVNSSADADALSRLPFKFNHSLHEKVTATDQKSSGRCWLFGGLNVLRHKMIAHYKLDPAFELSQAYLSRWDKIEKCNAALELIYELSKLGKDNQSIEYVGLIDGTLGDGGTWGMFVNVVKKYGVVPKDVFPDTFNAAHTARMNALVGITVKKASNEIHARMSRREFEAYKKTIMKECYRIVTLCVGGSVKKFRWTFKQTREESEYTPLSFYKKLVRPLIDVSKFVSISHFPPEKYDQVLGVEYLHNVVSEGEDLKKSMSNIYLNLEMKDFKEAVFKSIKKNTGVWFACNYGHFLLNRGTVLDQQASNLREIFDVEFDLPKKASLETRASVPNHAMILTGCQRDKEGFRRWKVENSHGKDSSLKGFLTMSDEWFDQYVITAAVPIDCLSPDARRIARSTDRIKWLPFWSVLGTFA